MERLDRDRISDIILNAPAWARVGLTMPDRQMRERAADTLAATIVERIADHDVGDDLDQLRLPI